MQAKEKINANNMTEGSPFKLIFTFSLPLIAGSALQQVYNMADSIIVGNFVSTTALVAVGIAFPVIFLMSSLFMGLSIGAMIMVSQYYGAEDYQNMRRTINTVYTALIVGGIPLTIIGILLANPILNLLSVPPDARSEAYIYLVIVLAGLMGSLGYNANSGILQGVGDSKTPLLLLAISCLLDNALNLLFVLVFHMGVSGAALSTIIGQGFSWVFGIYFINKKYPMMKIRPFSFVFDKAIFKRIMKLGIPSGIQSALFSIATILLARLVNLHGTNFSAGFNGANKLDTFAFLPIQSFATAATTFTGQNIGAGKVERVKEGLRVTICLGIGFSLLSILVIPAGPYLMRMFTPNQAVIDAGMIYLVRVMPFYSLLAVLFVVNSVIRGAGESFIPMVSAITGICLARLPIAYVLAHFFGADNMFFSYPIGWVISLCIAVPYFLSGRWKNKSITDAGKASVLAADFGDTIL